MGIRADSYNLSLSFPQKDREMEMRVASHNSSRLRKWEPISIDRERKGVMVSGPAAIRPRTVDSRHSFNPFRT